MWKADRRLWLTADRNRVVEDGDAEAAFLLAGAPGVEVPDDVAERYGLKGQPKAEPEETETQTPQLEDKALRGSKEPAARSRSRSKSDDENQEQ